MQLRKSPFPTRNETSTRDRSKRGPRQSSEGCEPTGEILGMDLEQYLLHLKVSELDDELYHVRRSKISDFIGLLGEIHRITEQLFPGPVTMEYASDPEDPTHEYIVFDVVARGGFADYRDVFYQWHDEVEKLVPGTLSDFRLLVHPKQ